MAGFPLGCHESLVRDYMIIKREFEPDLEEVRLRGQMLGEICNWGERN
jgi:hypothetical protein